jgi:hypothetical protein
MNASKNLQYLVCKVLQKIGKRSVRNIHNVCPKECGAVQCSAVQCSAVQCSEVPFEWYSGPQILRSVTRPLGIVLCSAVQCSAVQHHQAIRERAAFMEPMRDLVRQSGQESAFRLLAGAGMTNSFRIQPVIHVSF